MLVVRTHDKCCGSGFSVVTAPHDCPPRVSDPWPQDFLCCFCISFAGKQKEYVDMSRESGLEDDVMLQTTTVE